MIIFNIGSLAIQIVIGIVSGWIAGEIMGARGSWIHNLVLGVIGSFVGGFIASFLGIYTKTVSIGGIAVSVAGACLVLWLYRRFAK